MKQQHVFRKFMMATPRSWIEVRGDYLSVNSAGDLLVCMTPSAYEHRALACFKAGGWTIATESSENIKAHLLPDPAQAAGIPPEPPHDPYENG